MTDKGASLDRKEHRSDTKNKQPIFVDGKPTLQNQLPGQSFSIIPKAGRNIAIPKFVVLPLGLTRDAFCIWFDEGKVSLLFNAEKQKIFDIEHSVDSIVTSCSSVTRRVFIEVNDVIFHEVWALCVME